MAWCSSLRSEGRARTAPSSAARALLAVPTRAGRFSEGLRGRAADAALGAIAQALTARLLRGNVSQRPSRGPDGLHHDLGARRGFTETPHVGSSTIVGDEPAGVLSRTIESQRAG